MKRSIKPGLYRVVGAKFLSFVTETEGYDSRTDPILDFIPNEMICLLEVKRLDSYIPKEWGAKALFEDGTIGWFYFNTDWLAKVGL
jgi:hypothetical protein